MPSPFPGMDPYLDTPAFWSDFHSTFIHCWREAIADRLPDHYEASIDERVVLEDLPDDRPGKAIGPDVAIMRGEPAAAGGGAAPAGAATLEPVTIPLLMLDEPHQIYIKIVQRPDRELVAVLELLSPANKVGEGRGAYLEKRDALLRQRGVHLVELDFLVRGRRIPLRRPLPSGDYFALISRGDRRPDCEVYAWTIRQPLPTIPIPLKAPDPDIHVDLGAAFAIAYERGRYQRRLAYDGPPPVPLSDENRAWAEERARTLRR